MNFNDFRSREVQVWRYISIKKSINKWCHINTLESSKNHQQTQEAHQKMKVRRCQDRLKHRTKKNHRLCQHVGVKFESLWVRFLMDFGLPWGPPNDPQINKNLKMLTSVFLIDFRTPLFIEFYYFLTAKIIEKTARNRKRRFRENECFV